MKDDKKKEIKDGLRLLADIFKNVDLMSVSLGVVFIRPIRDVSENFRGRAVLYRTSKMIEYETGYEDVPTDSTCHVIISAVKLSSSIEQIAEADGVDIEKHKAIRDYFLSMPDEVLMFPARADGTPINFTEIGGVRGTMSHKKLIDSMGWILVGDHDDSEAYD